MPHKTKLSRFDLLLPVAAIEVVQKEAAIRGISPRTMGRILLVEKIKEMIGLAPDEILQDCESGASVPYRNTNGE